MAHLELEAWDMEGDGHTVGILAWEGGPFRTAGFSPILDTRRHLGDKPTKAPSQGSSAACPTSPSAQDQRYHRQVPTVLPMC